MKQTETPSPEQISVTFSPVINTVDKQVITSAWEFIRMVFCYDQPQAWLDIRANTPEGARFPRYEVIYGNNPEKVITYSMGDFAHSIDRALDLAWDMVNRDFSCKYGIWEDADSLKACIEDTASMEDHQAEDVSYWQDLLDTLMEVTK